MAKAVVGTKTFINSDTDTTPDGAEWRGEWVTFGGKQKKVFVETVEKSHIEPIIDPETNRPLLKRGIAGQTTGRIHTQRIVDGVEEREFIQIAIGNGNTIKQYTFREDPAEVAAREKKVRRQKALDALADKLAESDLDLDTLLDDAEKPKRKRVA